MKKKILSSLLAVCMVVSLCSMSGAVDETQKEFIFESDIGQEKVQLIVDAINGEDVLFLQSILCIFGHDMVETRVWEIIHRYYSSSPKCHQNVYKAVYCSRSSCNYIVFTLISSGRIPCCA